MKNQILKPDLWIVVDNSTDPEQDWSISTQRQDVLYEHIPDHKPIGWLRNRCIELALEKEADYIVFWDDDDYYPPTRISSGISALEANPLADIAASSKMYLLLTKENVFLQTGPFGEKHGTAATYTIRRRYIEKHRFLEKARGEELEFTDNWKAEMIQVPAEETIVVMGHSRNTVDKSVLLASPTLYNAKILNSDNGKMIFRMKWPVPWDIFQTTFYV